MLPGVAAGPPGVVLERFESAVIAPDPPVQGLAGDAVLLGGLADVAAPTCIQHRPSTELGKLV